MKNPWVDYWNNQKIFRMNSFQKSMKIFIRSTEPIMQYSPEDILLDIGSGPGYSADFLKWRVGEIHCVETSDEFIRMGRQRFHADENVFFYKLPGQYTDLSFLGGRKFTKIICKGVIAYYNSIEEVKSLILSVQKIAAPGAKFLITDISCHTGLFSDIWGVIKGGLKGELLLESLTFFVRARFSDYYRIRSEKGLLTMTMEELNELIRGLKLNADVLNQPLTYVQNRKHLLIRLN